MAQTEATEATKNRVDFLTAMAGMAFTIVLGIGGYEHMRVINDIERIDGINSGLSLGVAGLTEHLEQHSQELSRLWTQIDDISSSYTSNCDQLDNRLDQMDRSLAALATVKERVDELVIDFRETKGYYQRQVLPLLEQSNSLQLQRTQGMQ